MVRNSAVKNMEAIRYVYCSMYEIAYIKYIFVLSWFFGRMDREESNCILQMERDSGVFVVRESVSINGDYVLCVK